MMTIDLILGLSAFILTLISAIGRAPVWVPVILLCLLQLLHSIPQGMK